MIGIDIRVRHIWGMVEICKNLYLGDCSKAASATWIQEHKITAILNCGSTVTISDVKGFEKGGGRYKCLSLLDFDDADLAMYFDDSFGFLKSCIEQGRNILVYCYAGRSRSVSIVLAWRMYSSDQSFKEAYGELKKVYPHGYPNPGFIRQLEDLDRRLKLQRIIRDIHTRHQLVQSLESNVHQLHKSLR